MVIDDINQSEFSSTMWIKDNQEVMPLIFTNLHINDPLKPPLKNGGN